MTGPPGGAARATAVPAGSAVSGGEGGGSATAGSSPAGAGPHPPGRGAGTRTPPAGAGRARPMMHAPSATYRLRAWQRGARLRPSETVVLRIVMVAAIAVVAIGLALGRERLGVATPPFVADWAPKLHPLAGVSVAVLAAGCVAAPRLLDLRPGAFVIAVWCRALALGLALNVARLGTDGLSAVFDLRRGGEAVNEYLPGLPAIGYGV